MRIVLTTPIIGKTSAVFGPNLKSHQQNYLMLNNTQTFTANNTPLLAKKAKKPMMARAKEALATIVARQDSLFAPLPRPNIIEQIKDEFPVIKSKVRPVELTTKSGVNLTSWYIPAEDGFPTIVYLHGLKLNIKNSAGSMEPLAKEGYGLFAVEYPGYAGQAGKATKNEIREAVSASFDYLKGKKGLKSKDIGVMGESIGACIAIDSIRGKRNLFGAAILSCPSSTKAFGKVLINGDSKKLNEIPPAVRKLLKLVPARFMPIKEEYNYDNMKVIKEINCPIGLFHSKYDNFIAHTETEKIYKAAKKAKRDVKMTLIDEPGTASNKATHYSPWDKLPHVITFFNSLRAKANKQIKNVEALPAAS